MRRLLPLLGFLVFAACGSSDDGASAPKGNAATCTAGQQVACACPGGTNGAQACKADGSAFEACICGAGGAAGSGGQAASGGAPAGMAGATSAGMAGTASAGMAGTTSAGTGGTSAGAGGSTAGTAGVGGAGGSATGVPTTCAAAAAAPSNAGCEFWAADLDQQDGGGINPASDTWGVVVSNPQTAEVSVTVEINNGTPGAAPATSTLSTTKIPAGSAVEIAMPIRELDCGTKPNDYASPGTCLSSRAVRLTSTAPIHALQYNALKPSFSNDASLLMPTSALGKHYRAIGVAAGHPVPVDFPGMPKIIDRAYVTIIGTQSGTEVTVTPTWKIKANGPVVGGAAGTPITVTLGAFDVLNLETDDATMTEAQTNPLAGDLSGTTVTSTKPVAVFSGTESASAPVPAAAPKAPGWSSNDTCCLDHVEEQLVPMELWGTKYVVPRSKVRSVGAFVEPDVLRFVGGDEPATVTTNLPHLASFTLKAGEVLTTYTTTDVVVDASTPVGVALILVPQQYVDGAATGDPSIAILPSTTQHATDVTFGVPMGWTSTWVSIAAPATATLTVDGAAPANCVAGQSAGGYVFTRCELVSGNHRVKATEPFVALVGGYSSASSFLSIAGMRASGL